MSPLIVAIGGTLSEGSSSERALRIAIDRAEHSGATVQQYCADRLDFPMYRPGSAQVTDLVSQFLHALRQSKGVIVASPCYHGGLSGLIKNALDYTEEMSKDERPYLSGRSFGVIGCGAGWDGPVTVVSQLRTIGHALRAWNVPTGVSINTATVKLGAPGEPHASATRRLHWMADQVVTFARGWQSSDAGTAITGIRC